MGKREKTQRSLNRTYIEKKIAKNLTNHPITLGDLQRIVIPARSQQDLLQWVDEKDISQSHDLKAAIKARIIRMILEPANTRPDTEKNLIKPTISQAEELTTQGSGSSGYAPTQPEETEYDLGNQSGAVAIDWSNGKSQHMTLAGNVTGWSFSNAVNGTYVLRFTQGAGGNTVDMTGGGDWLWEGGAAGRIQVAQGSAGQSLYVLYYSEATTKYYVSALVDFS